MFPVDINNVGKWIAQQNRQQSNKSKTGQVA